MKIVKVHDGRVIKIHVPTAHTKRAGGVKITVGPTHRVTTEVMSPAAAVEIAHALLEAASKARQIDDQIAGRTT